MPLHLEIEPTSVIYSQVVLGSRHETVAFRLMVRKTREFLGCQDQSLLVAQISASARGVRRVDAAGCAHPLHSKKLGSGR
jgi:hypothetical protein